MIRPPGLSRRRRAVRPRNRGKIAIAAPACAALSLSVGLALAAPADFDTSFDTDGRVTLDLGLNERGRGVAVQPDGKILIVGYTTVGDNAVLWRLNPNGSPDTSFDTDGARPIDSGGIERGFGLALLPTGKVLVVGQSSIGQDAVIYRVDTNGALDSTFAGDGALGIDSGGFESSEAVAVQPDGKIVMVGHTSNGITTNDAAIYRLNPDAPPGADLDTTFDTDGKLGIDNGGVELAHAVAIQPNGTILVVGGSSKGIIASDGVVWRRNSDGSPDASVPQVNLDSGGSERASAVALQPDGKIVLAGSTTKGNLGDAAVWRLNADGTRDASFGVNGERLIDSGDEEYANALAIAPDGKIVVTGATTSDLNAVVYRLNADGSLDSSFDGDGKLIVTNGGDEDARGVALQSDGGIVVAGETSINQDVFAFRLKGADDPTPPAGTPTPPPDRKCLGNPVTLVGTNGADRLRGTAGRDVIAALAGNDRVSGLGGNDLVCGGSGNDVLIGGAGKDRLLGQSGRDTLRGGSGRDRLEGGAGRDRLIGGTGRDRLIGGSGRDRLTQ